MSGIYAVTPQGYLQFSAVFFEECMREYLESPQLKVTAAHFVGEVGVTATTRMKYSGEHDKLLGLFRYRIDYAVGGERRRIDLLVKSKTHYGELVARLAGVLVKGGVQVPDLERLLASTELCNTHMKEIHVFRLHKTVPAFTRVLPAVYGTYANDETRQYIVLEEFLDGAYVIKDYTDISFWTFGRIEMAVRDFSRMHAAFYGKYDALVGQGWLGKTMDAAGMVALTPLWRAYAARLRSLVGSLFDEAYYDSHLKWIDTLGDWWGRTDSLTKTLIFNDAQIRNLAVRSPERDPRLVLYDWECASIQLPQRDLVEFLSYAIDERIDDVEIAALLEAARAQLAADTAQPIDRSEWLTGCLYSIRDLHVNRMACQLALHVTLKRPDIERVFQSSLRILRVVESGLGRREDA